MSSRIALLRGINVGGKHKLPMKELVRVMEAGGFSDVRTYIQSGNVVFRSSAGQANTLAPLIEREFGFAPAVFLLTAAELRKAMEQNPFTAREGKHLHFFFFDCEPCSVDFALLDSLKAASEDYRLLDRVLYLHAPEGIGRSKLVEKLSKAFPGVTMTARNLNTVKMLAEMAR